MQTLTEKAYAKVNLTLSVGNKREDGYHNISSIMQTISLCDILTLKKSDKISLVSDCKFLPTDERNLAVQAAKLFFEKTAIRGGVDIELKKNIPVSAGLGGGSADAAAVLRGLNRLYKTRLTDGELCDMGAKLGADIPFCVIGGTALAEGIGERLTPIANNTKMYFIVSPRGKGVSTKQMYALLSKQGKRLNIENDAMIDALRIGDTDRVSRLMSNDFELISLDIKPSLGDIKRGFRQTGAIRSMLSGSGSAVFGLYDNKDYALAAQTMGIFAEKV